MGPFHVEPRVVVLQVLRDRDDQVLPWERWWRRERTLRAQREASVVVPDLVGFGLPLETINRLGHRPPGYRWRTELPQ